MTMQTPVPAPLPGGPPEELILGLVVIVGFVVAGVILAPLIKALARRIEGRHLDQGLVGEVDNLRSRVAELEEIQHRMAELEERVDFSERLLTQAREQQSLRAEH